MSFLVDASTRVVIQGVTGRLGRFVTGMMSESGIPPVGGVSPGKGGGEVHGVPVFDTMEEAVAKTGANSSLVLVPGAGLLEPVCEALDAGIELLNLMVDGVPINTSLEVIGMASEAGATIVGPNSPGVLSPGKAMVGALNPKQFRPGDIAVISRSGGMMSTLAHVLAVAGMGTSTCVGIGGDSVIGLSMAEAVTLAEADPGTRAIVLYGEIGTTQEETVADLVHSGAVSKPVAAYVAGSSAPSGIRYSHAGAQVDGDAGSAAGKKARLRSVGVHVAERYVDLPALVAKV